ncbi:MAG: 3-hydroxyacyl-CoA dehydrogenase/enoyl-CoA hydratase family protein [Acidobacteriia bacterium]|nr:3-hydroxyacyl-CoA dehydrogenase/enoyl-CoA hydratase family protein [Terriglobia bacterium]
MTRSISKVAVLGAGTMGAQIAAHFANAGISCLLLDMVPQELSPEERQRGLSRESAPVRNRLAGNGLDQALKMKPAAFFVPEAAARVRVGNFEDDLKDCADCDWIIEAVAENLEIKQHLLERLETFRQPGSLVSSNTSGLPLAKIAVGRSDDFRRHWIGTHFFNPPRYMKLVEIIPTPESLPEVTRTAIDFCDRVLGKGVVLCHDTPNFIANRIGTYGMMRTIQVMCEDGYSIEEVDAITGPAMGRPRTASFRTLDLVGLDVFAHVAQNMYIHAADDEARGAFVLPDFLQKMLTNRWYGNKSKQGFYKKVKSEGGDTRWALDYKTMEYRPKGKVQFASLEAGKNIDEVGERLRTLVNAKDRAGVFAWKTLSDALLYAARHIPEIADDIVSIDNALRWGFNWELGPFETWDALGVKPTIERMQSEGKSIPAWIQDLLTSGKESFYSLREGRRSYFDLLSKDYKALPQREGVVALRSLRHQSRVLKSNPGASLIDLGDGVIAVEFHSKMNALGSDALQMIQTALKEAEKNFAGVVIANEGENFSVGANLMMLIIAAQEQEWDDIDLMVRTFQGVTMAMKYSPKPVVVAPFGMTLGGGCEVTLHGQQVCAAAETYIGLVELGVGLVPAGGGSKEFLLRHLDRAGRNDEVDLFPFVKQVFETVGMARVATSAQEAQQLGFLRSSDVTVMNRDRLIGRAKQAVLELARREHSPGQPRTDIPVLGNSALATLKLGLYLMREAGYISDHDVTVGTKLAWILCGGELSSKQKVSEQYLLDLEREAFLSLCGERKTLERIQYTLKTGKPLRN